MAYTLRIFPCFERQLKDIKKHFPLAADSIDNSIASLKENPLVGNAFPGFGDIHVRKKRLALKEYKLSESGGLRLIFMVSAEKSLVVPLHMYKKGRAGGENEVICQTKKQLKAIIADLQ